MPLIPLIAAFFASVIGFIIRHPFVSKMMIFAIFIGLVSTGISYMFSIVQPYIFSSPYLGLLAYLGLVDALSMFLTIIIAGWGVKQILAFVRS